MASLGLAMVKCRKWGDLWWLGVTHGHRKCRHSTEISYLTFIETMHLSTLYCFRDIAIYLSKFADYSSSHLCLAPLLRVTPVEIREFGINDAKDLRESQPIQKIDFLSYCEALFA